MMLSGQKTIAGLAAICTAIAMLALPLSYSVPVQAKEMFVYLNQVHFFVPQNDAIAACGAAQDMAAIRCARFDR